MKWMLILISAYLLISSNIVANSDDDSKPSHQIQGQTNTDSKPSQQMPSYSGSDPISDEERMETLCDPAIIGLLRHQYHGVEASSIQKATYQSVCNYSARGGEGRVFLPIQGAAIGFGSSYQDSSEACLNDHSFFSENYARRVAFSYLPKEGFEFLTKCLNEQHGLMVTAQQPNDMPEKTTVYVSYTFYDDETLAPKPGIIKNISIEPVHDGTPAGDFFCNNDTYLKPGTALYSKPRSFTCTHKRINPTNPIDPPQYPAVDVTVTLENNPAHESIRLGGTLDKRLFWNAVPAIDPKTNKPYPIASLLFQCHLSGTPPEQQIDLAQTILPLSKTVLFPNIHKDPTLLSAGCAIKFGRYVRVGHKTDQILAGTMEITTRPAAGIGKPYACTDAGVTKIPIPGAAATNYSTWKDDELKAKCLYELEHRRGPELVRQMREQSLDPDQIGFLNTGEEILYFQVKAGPGDTCSDKPDYFNFQLAQNQPVVRDVGEYDACWCVHTGGQPDCKESDMDTIPGGSAVICSNADSCEVINTRKGQKPK